MTDRPRWWLIGVAALLAALFLYQSIGLVWAIGLFVGSMAALAAYRFYRGRKSVGVRCLTCEETLPSTARECRYCGGTRLQRP